MGMLTVVVLLVGFVYVGATFGTKLFGNAGVMPMNEIYTKSDALVTSWWWNQKMTEGPSDSTTNYLHHLQPEVMDWIVDGGSRVWWWKNMFDNFPNGVIINVETTTVATEPTTTSAPEPTTPPFEYPALPSSCSHKTERDALGPFYWPFVPYYPSLEICPKEEILRSKLHVHGYVIRSDCRTVISNAKVEIWQADYTGNYTKACTGYVMTDDNGYYNFTASMPGPYPGRPLHTHFQVTKSTDSGVRLVTQMYFQSDFRPGKRPSLTVQDMPQLPPYDLSRKVQFNFIL